MLIDVHTHTPRRKAPPSLGEEQREVKRRTDLDKLLFGSDFPIATPQETPDVLTRGGPPIPEDEVMKIAGSDSLALLGLA
jgi:predicted TIM-barrel fold metal-dependent hydrolase